MINIKKEPTQARKVGILMFNGHICSVSTYVLLRINPVPSRNYYS